MTRDWAARAVAAAAVAVLIGTFMAGTSAGAGDDTGTPTPTTGSSGITIPPTTNTTTSPPPPHVLVDSVDMPELDRARNRLITIRLVRSSTTPIRVSWRTADLEAVAGSDYDAAGGELTIPAGATTATVSVNVRGDRKYEANERFVINTTASSGGPATVTVRLLNDDVKP
jgi:hypothetical protein